MRSLSEEKKRRNRFELAALINFLTMLVGTWMGRGAQLLWPQALIKLGPQPSYGPVGLSLVYSSPYELLVLYTSDTGRQNKIRVM